MQRTLTLGIALLLAGCSDPSPRPEPAANPAATPAPGSPSTEATPAPPLPETAPLPETTPPTTARPTAPSAETLTEVASIVREARTLEHAGDHRGALRRFDDALRLVPSQPRVLCEAGFIAHRAGDTALAARRIDTALAVFGAERTISDRLRVPLAMCLYNRGIVAEAMSDPRVAEDAFASSLRLRPNATVEAALARARAAVSALPPGARAVATSTAADVTPSGSTEVPSPEDEDEVSRVGGLVLNESYALETSSAEAYERALAAGLRGVDEWSYTHAAAATTRVRRWHSLHGTEHPNVEVHTVVSVGRPLVTHRLVIGWHAAEGYQSYSLELGSEGSDEGNTETVVSVHEVGAAWLGPVLRVDLRYTVATSTHVYYTGDDDERCTDGVEETVNRDVTILCVDEDDYRVCQSLSLVIENAGTTSYSHCGDDDGSTDTTPAIDARAVFTPSREGFTISQVRDEDAVLNVSEGTYAWSELGDAGEALELVEWVSDDEE